MCKVLLAFVATACLTLADAGAPPAHALSGGGSEPQDEYRHRLPPIVENDSQLEVLVEGRPLAELAGRGRIYVEAQEGAEYELRIRNPFPVRVAVALAVDGLNTIDARRTTSWDASKWVLEPYQTILITGWQMSTERARRFYFTSEPDSYAGRLGRKSDLGVITAVFYREARPAPMPITPPRPYPLPAPRTQEEEERRRPEGEMKTESGAAGRSDSPAIAPPRRDSNDDDYAATGIGRTVENQVRWVHLQLESRPAREVTIRYEYRPALVRLGVLPRPQPETDALERRERARGFADPRFCPEP